MTPLVACVAPQAALLGSRAALTRLKGMAAAGSHTWLRLALISGDKSAAALFDDLSLAGVARGNTKRNASGHGGSTNAQWVATIQAAGGLVRTNIPMKNTILRIALTNKKQVRVVVPGASWGWGDVRGGGSWEFWARCHAVSRSPGCCGQVHDQQRRADTPCTCVCCPLPRPLHPAPPGADP